MRTVSDNDLFYKLDDIMKHEAARLSSRRDMILLSNKTYSELFNKIIKVISEDIFRRFVSGSLSLAKPPKKDQAILFQLIASLNMMHPKEMIRFKMLGNFLESENGIETLERVLYSDKSDIPNILGQLNNSDILMSFIYFNISSLRINRKPVNLEKENLNQNLCKLFLRHYEDFAKANKLNIESDDEDYTPVVVIPKKNDEISLGNLNPEIKVAAPKPPTVVRKKSDSLQPNATAALGKKKDIFAADERTVGQLKESDLKNRIEFPTLGDGPARPAPVATGWGAPKVSNNDLYLYDKKGALSKKEKEEHFPTLGEDGPSKPKAAPPEPKLSKPSSKVEAPPTAPGEYNWLEENRKQLNSMAMSNGLDIMPAKKKSKKK